MYFIMRSMYNDAHKRRMGSIKGKAQTYNFVRNN